MVERAASRGGYYYGWNIVGITVLAQLASFGIAINCLSLYLPVWSHDLHAPISALAFCYTAPGTVFCLLGPLTGHAADRLSVRWMITLGVLGVALLFALASQVTHAWQLIALFSTLAPVSMVIAGFVPCQVLVTRWFERRRGAAIGLSALGQSLAGAILPPILAVAMPAMGWRHLFQVIAGFIAFVCAPAAALLIRDRPKPEEGRGVEFAETTAEAKAAQPHITIGAILKRRNFWVLGISSVLAGFMSSGFLVNLAPMAANQGLSTAQAGSLLAVLSLVTLGAKLVAGFAIDRLGGRIVLGAVLALGTAGVGLAQVAHGYNGLLAESVLIAACGASIVPIATLVAREFGPEVVGRAMGMVTFLGVVGVTAPPIVAAMREATGGYHAPLMLLTVLGGAATLNVLLLLRERGREPVSEVAAA